MTTQAIAENKTNYVPVAATTAIGAGLGATVLAPAKYNSFEKLVEEATSGDKFELAKLADDAAEETKTAYNTVKGAIDSTKDKLNKVTELFKAPESGTAPEKLGISEVATKLGIANAPADEAAFKALKTNNSVAEALSKIAKDGEIKITDELTALFNAGETKGTADQVKAAYKTITGQEFAEGAKMTEDMQKTVAKYISERKDALSLAERATAKEGALTLTQDAAKSYVKQGSQAVQEAFGKVNKLLGKSWMKGAAIYGAIGLAAGWVISKFVLGGKKEAA